MPLSSDWTALNTMIDQMAANGDTNQAIGLAWGWHALTSAAPLDAPVPPSNTQQVIVLLTDGLNTQNRWSSSQSSIDARQRLLCQNIKKANVTIYTVLVMSGNSSLLQGCAGDSPDTGDPSKYFALTQAGQIITAFNQIGTSMMQLHVVK